MIIFCDECGERYVLEKNEIKKVVTFECEICHNLIKISVLDHEVKNRPNMGRPGD